MMIPTPMPRIIPPNTVASSTSFVIPGIGCRKDTQRDKEVTENKVDITKVLPICLYPKMRKGMFRKKMKTPSGNLDR
jgi:hypothetical protein